MSLSTANTGINDPLLSVYAEGGRACSVVDQENPTGCHIQISQLTDLLEGIHSSRRRLFNQIQLRQPLNSDHGIHVNQERLQQFGRDIQNLFRQDGSSAVVALVSSSKLPRYAMAAAAALSPDDLLSLHQSNQGKSLIIAASRYPMGHQNDDVGSTLEHALFLAAHQEMKGKAGVLYENSLYPLTNLDANHGEPPVLDHTSKMAKHTAESGGWMFYDSNGPENQLFGKLNNTVSIDGPVRTLVVPDGSDDADTSPNLDTLMNSEFGTNLKGLVLKTKRHRDPLTYTDPKLLQKLDELELPVMLVGRRNGNLNGHSGRATSNLDFAQNSAYLIDGDGMYSGQAKVLLGALHGEAIAEGIDDTNVPEVVKYIRDRMKALQFIEYELRH